MTVRKGNFLSFPVPREHSPETMNTHRLWPLYLFALALAMRIVFLLAIYPGQEQVDYFEDVGIAINLVEGKGYVLDFTMVLPAVPVRPTAAKPPAYPFLVALVFFAFGTKNFFALFIVHAVLAGLTCVLLYLSLAAFSHYKGVIAGAAFALYPPFVYHSIAVPESTALTLFWISAFSYGLLKIFESPNQRRWMLTSIAGGLLALTEPVTIPFILLSVLYLAYLTRDGLRQIVLQCFIAVFALAMTVAPWTVRNYLTFNEFVFIKSNFGSSLKDSLYRSGIRLPRETRLALAKELQGVDEVTEDRAVKKAMLSWIAANPEAYSRLLPKNFMNFWWETERYKDNRSTSYLLGRKIPYIGLLVLSVPSLLWALVYLGAERRRADLRVYHNLLLLLIVTYTAIYTMVGSWNMRYHFPVELAMFPFCAETLFYAVSKGRFWRCFGGGAADSRWSTLS